MLNGTNDGVCQVVSGWFIPWLLPNNGVVPTPTARFYVDRLLAWVC